MSALFSKLKNFVLPKSQDNDLSRREFILNILLLPVILMLGIASINNTFRFFGNSEIYKNSVLSISITYLLFLFFIFLYFMSRKGFFRLASYLFILSFFFLASYLAAIWGTELQASLLFYVLIIVMSGVLINSRFAFIVTIFSVFVLGIINYLQKIKIIIPNRHWTDDSADLVDVVMFGIIFSAIAVVSWLSNREIEKSLNRARKSEAELKIERDSLEIKVKERTKELRELQAEKMVQLYRFAEMGRLSSGLFHDLVNPLSVVALYMEKAKIEGESDNMIKETKTSLDKAMLATKKMGDFIIAVRKQISRQGNISRFSLNEEIRQMIDILSHKAKKENVKISFQENEKIEIIGDPVRFNQAVLNLISNAIDSYVSVLKEKTGEVKVALKKENGNIIFSVRDWGMGIAEENLQNIFEPFFSTKSGDSLGIGLSMTKRIIEKDFNGSIKVESKLNKGAIFSVIIPENL